MEKGFPVLMLCFAALLALYGLVLFLTKDPGMIPRNYAVDMKDGKMYAQQFGKGIMLIALSPALCGITGLLFGNKAAVIVLIVSFIVFMWLTVKIVQKAL